MPIRQVIWDKPTNCSVFAHVVNTFCLPAFGVCDLTLDEGLIKDCELVWCSKMKLPGDIPYYNPIADGAKIMLQTQFFDEGSTDRTDPDSGWTNWINIELYDEAGVLVANSAVGGMGEIASRWLNGWNGKNSIQIVEIDTSLFATECFTFRIVTGQGLVKCSEPFRRILTCTDDIISLNSSNTGFDCHNNYYGLMTNVHGSGSFAFDNTIYVLGNIRNAGGENESERFGISLITSVSVNNIWAVELQEKIPPYLERYIRNVIFAGNEIFVNGDSYTYESVRTSVLKKSQMFKAGFGLIRKCIIEHGANC